MKSIRFDTRQARATMDGTMTEIRVRLPLKYYPVDSYVDLSGAVPEVRAKYHFLRLKNGHEYGGPTKPPCQPGDTLYVQERIDNRPEHGNFYYHADNQGVGGKVFDLLVNERFSQKKTIPSIHMPKEAARLFLKVVEVRVERLRDITIAEITKEGISEDCRTCHEQYGTPCCNDVDSECGNLEGAFMEYERVWNGTIKKQDLDRYGWDVSPWVWVIKYEKVEADYATKL